MDPRLLLQLSAKNNQRKTLFEQDEGGLSQIIFNPSLGIFIPSVTFEPLCMYP